MPPPPLRSASPLHSSDDNGSSTSSTTAAPVPSAFRRGLRRRENALRLYQPRCVTGIAKFMRENNLTGVHVELHSLPVIKVFLQELSEDSARIQAFSMVSDVAEGDNDELITLLVNFLKNVKALVSLKLQFRSHPTVLEATIPHIPRSVKFADFTGSYIPSVTPEIIHAFRRFIIRSEPIELNLQQCGLTTQDAHAVLDCLEGLGPFMSLQRLYSLPLKEIGNFSSYKSSDDVMSILKDKAFCKRLVGKQVRVWWSPTSDPGRSDFAGRFWPTKVLQMNPTTMSFLVIYDNQDQGYVDARDVFPQNPYHWGGGLRCPGDVALPEAQRLRASISRCFRNCGWRLLKNKTHFPTPLLHETEKHTRNTRKRVRECQTKEENRKKQMQENNGTAVVLRSTNRRGSGSSPPSGTGSRRPSLDAQNITRMMTEDSARQLPSQVLLDFDMLMFQRENHVKLREAIQSRVAQLRAMKQFTLTELEFLILQVPAARLGQILYPGEICEFREATVDVTPDPSEYLVIVDSVYPTEPHYGLRYIFHDETEIVRVRSSDVRRALATPWEAWRDATLFSLRRCGDVQKQFHVDSLDVGEEDRLKEDVMEGVIQRPECTGFYRPRTSTTALNAATVNKQAVVSPRQLPTVGVEDFALWFLLQLSQYGHPLLSNEKTPPTSSSPNYSGTVESIEELRAQVVGLKSFRDEALELRDKFTHFSQRVGEIKKIVTCCICLTQPLTLLTLPCGHLVTCRDCGERVENCPMCREKIKKRIRVTNFSTDVYDTLLDFIAVDLN